MARVLLFCGVSSENRPQIASDRRFRAAGQRFSRLRLALTVVEMQQCVRWCMVGHKNSFMIVLLDLISMINFNAAV